MLLYFIRFNIIYTKCNTNQASLNYYFDKPYLIVLTSYLFPNSILNPSDIMIDISV